MAIMAIAYPPLILALAAAICWLTWRLLTASFLSLYFIGAAIFAGLIAIFLVCSLFVLVMKLGEPELSGFYLKRTHEPSIFALVERVARRLEVEPPTRVLIEPGFEAAIGRLRFKDDDGPATREHVLILGVQLVLVTSAAELTSIICHEIAHAASGDTRSGYIAHRFLYSMGAAVGVHDEQDGNWITWLVHLPILGYLKLYAILYLYESRQREFRADRAAARICGPQTTRDALRKSARFVQVRDVELNEVLRFAGMIFPRPRNLYDVFRSRLQSVSDKRWTSAENEAFMEPPTLWSTHPNLAHRFQALSEIDAPELASDRPAFKLFREWERTELMYSAQLFAMLDAREKAVDRALDRMARR